MRMRLDVIIVMIISITVEFVEFEILTYTTWLEVGDWNEDIINLSIWSSRAIS